MEYIDINLSDIEVGDLINTEEFGECICINTIKHEDSYYNKYDLLPTSYRNVLLIWNSIPREYIIEVNEQEYFDKGIHVISLIKNRYRVLKKTEYLIQDRR